VLPARLLVIASPERLVDGPWLRPAALLARPASALINVDFPTLERPRRQTSGMRVFMGMSRKRGAA
jgi:hypothetical protein